MKTLRYVASNESENIKTHEYCQRLAEILEGIHRQVNNVYSNKISPFNETLKHKLSGASNLIRESGGGNRLNRRGFLSFQRFPDLRVRSRYTPFASMSRESNIFSK